MPRASQILAALERHRDLNDPREIWALGESVREALRSSPAACDHAYLAMASLLLHLHDALLGGRIRADLSDISSSPDLRQALRTFEDARSCLGDSDRIAIDQLLKTCLSVLQTSALSRVDS